jgi:hypothetical protein
LQPQAAALSYQIKKKQMLKKSVIASVLLLFCGAGAHADHHLPRAEAVYDLLFSDIPYRAAYCSAVIEAHRPSASGGHLPDFFAWPGYPKAMIKWKYMLWQLDRASKAPPADSVRMKEARSLADADMVEMTSIERKQSAIFSAYTRMDSAACNDALSWLP